MASGVMMTTYSTKGTVHDFIKIKNYSAKVKSIRRQALDWDKIFAPPKKNIYVCSIKSFYPKYTKNSKNSTRKQTI